MAMRLNRAGRYGEFENRFLEEGRIYCTWDELAVPLTEFATKQDLQHYFTENDPDTKVKTAMNWAS